MPERSITTKEQKPVTRMDAVRKPLVKKPIAQTGRPTETILTGTWNAVKKPPEWLGKKTVEVYDKIRFPKLTPEEKKMKDKLHAMLKKHYKAVGWTETGIIVAATTAIIVKGIQYVRNRKHMQSIVGNETETNKLEVLSDGLPDVFNRMLNSLDSLVTKGLEAENFDPVKRDGIKKGALFRISTFVARGIPPDIAERIHAMKTAMGDKEELGIAIVSDWIQRIYGTDPTPELLPTLLSFNLMGFENITMFDDKKFLKIDTTRVLVQLENIFRVATHMSDVLPEVKHAVTVAQQALQASFEGSTKEYNPTLNDYLLHFIQSLYTNWIHSGVVHSVNGLQSRDEQISALMGHLDGFIQHEINEMERRGYSFKPGQREEINERSSLLSFALLSLGFPGAKEIGIRLKSE